MSRKKYTSLKIDKETFKQIKRDIRNENLSRNQIICHFGISSSTYTAIKGSRTFADYKRSLQIKNEKAKKAFAKKIEQSIKIRDSKVGTGNQQMISFSREADFGFLVNCLWLCLMLVVMLYVFMSIFTGSIK